MERMIQSDETFFQSSSFASSSSSTYPHVSSIKRRPTTPTVMVHQVQVRIPVKRSVSSSNPTGDGISKRAKSGESSSSDYTRQATGENLPNRKGGISGTGRVSGQFNAAARSEGRSVEGHPTKLPPSASNSIAASSRSNRPASPDRTPQASAQHKQIARVRATTAGMARGNIYSSGSESPDALDLLSNARPDSPSCSCSYLPSPTDATSKRKGKGKESQTDSQGVNAGGGRAHNMGPSRREADAHREDRAVSQEGRLTERYTSTKPSSSSTKSTRKPKDVLVTNSSSSDSDSDEAPSTAHKAAQLETFANGNGQQARSNGKTVKGPSNPKSGPRKKGSQETESSHFGSAPNIDSDDVTKTERERAKEREKVNVKASAKAKLKSEGTKRAGETQKAKSKIRKDATQEVPSFLVKGKQSTEDNKQQLDALLKEPVAVSPSPTPSPRRTVERTDSTKPKDTQGKQAKRAERRKPAAKPVPFAHLRESSKANQEALMELKARPLETGLEPRLGEEPKVGGDAFFFEMSKLDASEKARIRASKNSRLISEIDDALNPQSKLNSVGLVTDGHNGDGDEPVADASLIKVSDRVHLEEAQAAADEEYLKDFMDDQHCEFCNRPLPLNPSSHFVQLKISVQTEPDEDSELYWEKRNLFCEAHIAETSTVPLGIRAEYPTDIDFIILYKRLEKGWIRTMLRMITKRPALSAFYRMHCETIDKIGQKRWNSDHVQLVAGVAERIMPGYYGPLGGEIIKWHFQNLKEWGRLTLDERVTHPLSPTHFIARILVPEAANLLIMDDRSLVRGSVPFKEAYAEIRAASAETERIRQQSVEFGKYMFRGDGSKADEILQSWTAATKDRKGWLQRVRRGRHGKAQVIGDEGVGCDRERQDVINLNDEAEDMPGSSQDIISLDGDDSATMGPLSQSGSGMQSEGQSSQGCAGQEESDMDLVSDSDQGDECSTPQYWADRDVPNHIALQDSDESEDDNDDRDDRDDRDDAPSLRDDSDDDDDATPMAKPPPPSQKRRTGRILTSLSPSRSPSPPVSPTPAEPIHPSVLPSIAHNRTHSATSSTSSTILTISPLDPSPTPPTIETTDTPKLEKRRQKSRPMISPVASQHQQAVKPEMSRVGSGSQPKLSMPVQSLHMASQESHDSYGLDFEPIDDSALMRVEALEKDMLRA